VVPRVPTFGSTSLGRSSTSMSKTESCGLRQAGQLGSTSNAVSMHAYGTASRACLSHWYQIRCFSCTTPDPRQCSFVLLAPPLLVALDLILWLQVVSHPGPTYVCMHVDCHGCLHLWVPSVRRYTCCSILHSKHMAWPYIWTKYSRDMSI
jgi:hypothetical protein